MVNLALSREWSNEHHRSFEIAHVRVVYTTCVLSSKTPQNAGPTTAWHRPPLMIPLKTGISAKNSNVSGVAVGPGLARPTTAGPRPACRKPTGLVPKSGNSAAASSTCLIRTPSVEMIPSSRQSRCRSTRVKSQRTRFKSAVVIAMVTGTEESDSGGWETASE